MDNLIAAVAGWAALLVDWDGGGSYVAPIVAWLPDQKANLTPICPTNDQPGYPRLVTQRELVRVFSPDEQVTAGDFEEAEQHERVWGEDT